MPDLNGVDFSAMLNNPGFMSMVRAALTDWTWGFTASGFNSNNVSTSFVLTGSALLAVFQWIELCNADFRNCK